MSAPEEPVCVVTRITFGRWRSVPGAVRRFRRLRRIARRTIPGLVDVQLHVHRGAIVTITSLWRDEHSLLQFTTLNAHSNAVRYVISKKGQVWSGVFRLDGTSSMSKPWIGTIRHWQPVAAAGAEWVTVDES